ncbi:lamin tail domain-containing protein [Macrococcus bovicus]|uniref:Lamin tail domain-containing protein n=2 Tax=Macrococcus bovicus TaxID=69968 RepID=A0A4V3BFP6_9STAP|nr:lamin tail domain-containing protein [Macrococcus bovicus]
MIVLSLVLSFSGQRVQAARTLIISEYIEGSGYNKAVEIYNPTSAAVDLSTYSLVNFVNGASETTGTVAELKLTGNRRCESDGTKSSSTYCYSTRSNR